MALKKEQESKKQGGMAVLFFIPNESHSNEI